MQIVLIEKRLYFLLTGVATALFLVALGPGLTGGYEGTNSLQHRIFHLLCHQDPVRSYTFNEQPMAVCARCFGMYTGFLIFTLAMGVMIRLLHRVPVRIVLQLLLVTIVINVVDVTGNFFNLWANSLASRSISGFLMGSAVAIFLTDQFFRITEQKEHNHGK
jgi:uncharacterized membrane protein